MAKHHGIKLPKRVAGVKIPKVIRKGPLGQFLNSGAGQLVLAETLVAAAAAFTAAKADEVPLGETVRHPVDSVRRVGHAMATAGAGESERLAHAFREAGRAFREALHGDGLPPWQDLDDTPRAKKKSSSRASSLH
jgi:hypothetical protein